MNWFNSNENVDELNPKNVDRDGGGGRDGGGDEIQWGTICVLGFSVSDGENWNVGQGLSFWYFAKGNFVNKVLGNSFPKKQKK